MRPDRMRIMPDEKQFVGGYVYEVNGKKIEFAVNNVMHTKFFAPLDDWYGMSPLVVAARSVDVRNAGGDWNLALLQNSGRTPGFFVSKERLGDVSFERMREQLLDRYQGSRNVGLPGLLEEGVTWVANGMNPLDMDWSDLSREAARDIALAIGVPSEMLGDSEVKTFANYGDARASFYTETVLPRTDILRDELNRWLVPMFGDGLWLDYDTEEVEALAPLRAARWTQVQTSTFLTINEKREATGYDPIPEGDVIILNATNATLDEVANGTAGTGQGDALGKPRALPGQNPGGKPNDSGSPGGSGTPDGGMGSAVDSGEKSRARKAVYDPLDDILAGKVVKLKDYRPKVVTPVSNTSRYRHLVRTGTR
jgi:HK97 family phage portal protein